MPKGGKTSPYMGPTRLLKMDRSSQFNFIGWDNQLGTVQSVRFKLKKFSTWYKTAGESDRNGQSYFSRGGNFSRSSQTDQE